MIIKPVMMRPLADGYIDRSRPHTINAIIVDDLGRDEVLLLATDSGNVCGYHVEAIYSAIIRCAKSGYNRPFNGAEVSPFFVENVGMSAWGLATHKFARLIAVSANTGQIMVYAFALVDPAVDSDDVFQSSNGLNLTSDQTWVSIDSRKQLRELQKLMPRNHRSRNLRLTYRGHFDNIPCVSFANFDLDASGTWMVSTDISNRVIVWRIWDDLWPSRVYYPGHPMNNPPQRGWTVIPLDPRTFKQHRSIKQACGCEPIASLIGPRVMLDLSKTIEEVPDASQIFVFGSSKRGMKNPDHLPDDVFSLDCCIDDGNCPRSSASSKRDFPSQASDQAHVDEKAESSSEHPRPSSGYDPWLEESLPKSRRLLRSRRPLSSLFEEDNEHYRVLPCLHPDYGYERSPDMDLVHNWGNNPVHRKTVSEYLKSPFFAEWFRTARTPTFFPVIHFSEHHISLAPYPLDSEYHVLCKTPLFQRFHFDVEISSACDRFNMVKHVPELGLVVAASQKGRVAIISLTWQDDIGYAFRVDWILPFYSQERNDDRPMIPLLGLAVSPMPGFEIPQDVPCIPRGVNPDDWLEFNYRILNPDENDSPSSPSSSRTSSPTQKPTSLCASAPSADHNPDQTSDLAPASESDPESHKDSPSEVNQNEMTSPNDDHQKYTLPELHAQASLAYRPHERWHGWHPSRHYRLLLLFCDNSVMSYEFWHDWKN